MLRMRLMERRGMEGVVLLLLSRLLRSIHPLQVNAAAAAAAAAVPVAAGVVCVCAGWQR